MKHKDVQNKQGHKTCTLQAHKKLKHKDDKAQVYDACTLQAHK